MNIIFLINIINFLYKNELITYRLDWPLESVTSSGAVDRIAFQSDDEERLVLHFWLLDGWFYIDYSLP